MPVGKTQGLEQWFSGGSVGAGFVSLLGNGHADVAGQHFDSITEFQSVVFHQEADGGAVRSAAKAVVELLAGGNGKGGGFFVVEWAAGFKFPACFLQLYARFNQRNNICTRQQFVNE